MVLKAVIVDDETRSREFLRTLVEEFCTDVKVAGLAANVPEAVALINTHKPDVVFLDIELQTGTGFDVLQHFIDPQFQVIFTTAYDHYAIRAIKFSAIDYLLKPIDIEELQLAIEKAKSRVENNSSKQTIDRLLQNIRKPANSDFSITLATSEGLEFVPIQNIIRLEASGPYTHFFLKEGRKIMVSKNLKEYETMLGDHNFFRVHNSHIINLKEVKRMIKTDGGYAVMNDESTIAISPKKRDEFMTQIGQRLL
ncbi:response regulator transcription factor [Segetibacter sp. 3557_3]|uniref:LytR/AlgR family response regulator transcription factor n=1 Tax=Segetibacter sp. 3557_3 TaxID=2547429 RepID=UPI00105892B1|nr:LytTR family DNA-binding domain-containing protein [Segetibacter sp. 3557_3]TDH28589.1 response regulator transcription factor [Segetibacter sp. 3557_3]